MTASGTSELERIYEGFNDACVSDSGSVDAFRIMRVRNARNSIRLQLNNDRARGYWDLFRPDKGMLICVADGIYHADHQQHIFSNHDIISIRFVLSGSMYFTFDRVGKVDIPQASASVIYVPEDVGTDLAISKDSHLCSVTLHIHPEILRSRFALDQRALPKNLSSIIYDGAFANRAFNYPLNAYMMNSVLDLVKMPYAGARRQIATEAKVAELICCLFHQIEKERYQAPPQVANRRTLRNKVFDAQRILVDRYNNPPTIQALARHVGLNRSTLCAEFKNLLGKTIFEFLQEHRMTIAQELLRDKRYNIAEIAEIVGYQYPTNFTAAFKKHFGTLPRISRK